MDSRRADSRQTKLGWMLTVLGIGMIIGGVFFVLNAVGYAEDQRFENRRSYNQVKVAVHESYPLGLVIGLVGLATAMFGSYLRREPEDDAN